MKHLKLFVFRFHELIFHPPNLWTSHPGPQAVVFPGFGPFFLSLRIGPKWQIGMDSPYMFPLNLWVVSVFSYPIFDVAWYVFWYFCLIISLKPTVCTWNRPFAPKGNHPHSIHVCYIYHHLSTWMVDLYGFHVYGTQKPIDSPHVHAFSGIHGIRCPSNPLSFPQPSQLHLPLSETRSWIFWNLELFLLVV